MVERIIGEQVKKAYEIFERFRGWNGTIQQLNSNENTNTCCELMEDTASMQHELFRILHFLVYNGGLKVCSELRQSRSRARSCSPSISASESPVMRRTCSTVRNIQMPNQNATPPVNMRANSAHTVIHPQHRSNIDSELLEMLLESQNQCDRLARRLREQIRKQNDYRQYVGSQEDESFNLQPMKMQVTEPVGSFSNKPVCCCTRNELERSSTASSVAIPTFVHPVSMPDSCILSASDSQLYRNENSEELHQWLSPLVARYNDIFTNARIQAMDRLQSSGIANYERCQRIIFYTVQVCFAITRRQLRRTISTSDTSGTLYNPTMRGMDISCRKNTLTGVPLDTQQLTRLFLATTRRLTRRPPPDCACRVTSAVTESYYFDCNEPVRGVPLTQNELSSLEELIREVCSLAWYLLTERQAMASRSFTGSGTHQNGSLRIWHVDVDRSAKPADKYDPKCYRRSYDSDFSATMVHHFVWPCLILFSRPIQSGVQQYGGNYLSNSTDSQLLASVLSKGEACTRNPLNSASQQDKAAALLNNECNMTGCPHMLNDNNTTILQPTNRKKRSCMAGFSRKR
ncbi:hypothetical protein D915_008668 [Fasciola hepatica]|uniref:Uncharacterized protein n=1 Tax=Fasciola hepatica TaxID=6192 RepID=A0A4E0R1N1_FASHE|nr:hypothetical protein D915_008668 [Fasciola hepatica]